MSDISYTPRASRQAQARGFEYWAYFTLLFLIGLPFATGGWLFEMVTRGRSTGGIITRSWKKAAELTPIIFSA